MTFSPAPWRLSKSYANEAVLDKRGKMVADCCIVAHGVTQEMVEANARLVSVAPEMFAMVKLIAEDMAPSRAEAQALVCRVEGMP